MFGQDEHHVSETRSGILTPASDTSLIASDGLGSGSRKRKRDGSTMDELLKDKFTVKPYPSTAPSKQHTLQPLILLPRSHLPLSSLDIAASAKALSKSRLYEAHVKILELEERMGNQPMVLIARLDDARTLYAVERESCGLYVLCQIGSWVNIQELRTAAVASKQEFPRTSEGPNNLFHGEPLPPKLPEVKFNKSKRLAIEAIQSKVKRPTTNLSAESQSIPLEPVTAIATTAPEERAKEPVVEDIVLPNAAEIFETLRAEYFKILYLEGSSLAVFAKNSLSRARAPFHIDLDSTLDSKDLIAFLESLVLSNSLIDKKYRDGIPTCISLVDIQNHSEDNADPATTTKAKKRKSTKKMKPGKNGLYPNEDALIRKWWSGHDDEAESGAPGDSRDERTKRRISQLRIRETQLQMIIILEILALQRTFNTEDVEGDLPTALPTTEAVEFKQKAIKFKKPDHLTTLIEVHIDRLCIWQSLAVEEATKGPASHPQSVSEHGDPSTGRATHTDILRDFCVEVIAPFFSSRLPDRCVIINRKLGGPVVVAPPKPRLSKSSSFSGTPSRPGAITKRPVPVKPGRSLKRVLTEDRERRSMSRGPDKAIALMRSATMPTIPGLKREASEAPSLSGIPTMESQVVSKKFARREMDFSAVAPKPNNKAEKQAIIEAELKEAISAMKKPNRELAGKSIMETAEKRTGSNPRKPTNPKRSALFQAVQISATPKANRQKNMFTRPQHSSAERSLSDMVIPPSSLPKIPQSVSRSSGGLSSRNPFLSSIQATPTRKSVPALSKLSGNMGVFGDCPPSSPLQMRRSSAQLFSAVPESAVKNSSPIFSGVADTPIKAVIGHAHPVAQEPSNDKENLPHASAVVKAFNRTKDNEITNEESIYKTLGWDDADDMDELA